MAHPGILVNKLLTIEIPGRGNFRSRVLGLKKLVLIISLPMSERYKAAWLEPGTPLRINFEEVPNPEGTIEGEVAGRRLKPVPLLFVRLKRDIPIASATGERPYRIITVASGKGGTGKTFVAVNLAMALAGRKLQIGLLDGDLGTANAALCLGIAPALHLGHVVRGEKRLGEVGIRAQGGITLFPGAAASGSETQLSPWQFGRLLGGIAEVESAFDHLIIDTSSGISPLVTNFLLVADFILLVTANTPTALLDAYGLLKSVASQFWSPEVGLVLNKVVDDEAGKRAATGFLETASRFLGVRAHFLGMVREDPLEVASLRACRPLTLFAPDSPASRDLKLVAERLRAHLIRAAAFPILRTPGPKER